jgi:hypothetical protein
MSDNFGYHDPNRDRMRPPRDDLPLTDEDTGASYGLAGLLLGAIFVAAILAFVFSGNSNNESTQTAANMPAISQSAPPPNNPPAPSANPNAPSNPGGTPRTP